MLTTIEKILFTLLALASAYAAYRAADRIIRILRRGTGSLAIDHFGARLRTTINVFVTQRTVLKRRLWPSIAHAFIAWGFTYYLLANVGDGLQAFFPGFVFLGTDLIGNLYRLIADLLTVGVLVGMAAMLLRRWIKGRQIFGFNKNTLLPLKAAFQDHLDPLKGSSLTVFHVGSRFLGE